MTIERGPRLAVLDVETTGIRASTDRIIEVAVWQATTAGDIIDRWSTLIRPDDRELTGRLTALANAPTFADVTGDICERLAAADHIAGHNVTFDLRMLNGELDRLGTQLPTLEFLDTHVLATRLAVDTPNRSLAMLCHELDVPMTSWHTADGDVEATVGLIARLLARAAAWGVRSLDTYLRTWTGDDHWPPLPASGRRVVRDANVFPPGGRQPHSDAIHRPSWRRYGAGAPAATIDDDGMVIDLTADIEAPLIETTTQQVLEWAATGKDWPSDWPDGWADLADVVVAQGDDANDAALTFGYMILGHGDGGEPTPVDEALSDWYAADFRGRAGIDRLIHITSVLDRLDEHRSEFVDACIALADLYRRHGGRHDDVTAQFRRALTTVEQWCATTPGEFEVDRDDPDDDGVWADEASITAANLVNEWWEYLEHRRDVTALTELFDLVTSHRSLRVGSLAADLASGAINRAGYAGELTVMASLWEQLEHRWPVDATAAPARAGERVAAAYERAARIDDALATCEQAWAQGWADAAVANRHSLILERAKRNRDAVAVARRGLDLEPASGYTEQLTKRIVRCERRLSG